jgi:hypothetical protein
MTMYDHVRECTYFSLFPSRFPFRNFLAYVLSIRTIFRGKEHNLRPCPFYLFPIH